MPSTLHFTRGELRGQDLPVTEPEARIGRDASADIVITGADRRFVSRIHAAILTEGGRHLLEDRNSTNGTWVNGSRIQRVVLADGDEIQFGRNGPVALFRCGSAEAETVVAGSAWMSGAEPAPPRGGFPTPAPPGPSAPGGGFPSPAAGAPPPRSEERPSQLVRRLVTEALAVKARRSRGQIALLVIATVLLATAAATGATVYFGRSGATDQTFRRLAQTYTDRVVLVEVGLLHQGRYHYRGNGTGFVASDDGLVVTNKHVVYPHLYLPGNACEAESFRRRQLSYEETLVITIWPGGSRFRQTPSTMVGDRGLGYSSQHGTLHLVALAPDNLGAARTIECSDAFTGRRFTIEWRAHVNDNNDLAVLRVSGSTRLEPIPLAANEPAADDPVMVLGFPRGVAPLETNDADPIRRTGQVIRVHETIQTDAVVLGGNSGGPLIDRDGNVIGITTAGWAESLNMAIKVEYARLLLDRARTAPLR